MLTTCKACGNKIAPNALMCPQCGAPPENALPVRTVRTSRTTYVLLGAILGFCGLPGIHNLYAGYTGRGLTQLLGTIFTCWILWIFMFIWTIIEICTETRDGHGYTMS